MALLWVDGFEAYRTACSWNDGVLGYRLLRRYADIGSVDGRHLITTGRFSTYCLQIFGDTNGYLLTPALTTNDTLIVGIAVMPTQFGGAGDWRIISLFDGTQQGINVRYFYGDVAIYRDTTLLATSTGLNWQKYQWRYLELKVKCHDTTGTYEVRLGENTILSATGVDTKAGSNAYHDKVHIWGTGTSPLLDDFYICDSSGSDNNNFLGNVRVDDIYPNGDNSVAWTKSGGSTNYENVDETPLADDDTTYVESSTTNQTDLYDYGSISGVGSIKGIQINTDCTETDATSYTLITPVSLSGNQSDDTAQAVASSYTTLMRIVERDPDGNLWTINNVNAAQFGVKVG
jgi:hypothetical protein